MNVIGLTGGVGTGKSTVSGFLRDLGVTVIDADEATRAVQEAGQPAFEEIVREFGPSVLREGRLDRTRLAEIVFSDPEKLERLNRMVHPRVRQWMAERQVEADERGEPWVVFDIPLLYETRGDEMFKAVILAYADPEVAVRRLVEQRGFSERDARARVAAQMPIEEKRRRAAYVIDNSDGREATRAQTERVWAEITASSSSGP